MRELVARGVSAAVARDLSRQENPVAALQHPAMAEAIPNSLFEDYGLSDVKINKPSYGPPTREPGNKSRPLPEFRVNPASDTSALPLPLPDPAGGGFDCSFRITVGRLFDFKLSYRNPNIGKARETVRK